MSGQPFHSTGRGGAGNIGTDTNVYTDGGIVREGVQGQSVDGDFSTGRGGAGNITKSPRVGPQVDGKRRSVDMVPEVDVREAQDEFHTGRGGAGNVYKEKHGGHSHASVENKGFGDKIKQALHLEKDQKQETATKH